MNLLIAFFLLIIGTACGSFLSVVIHRFKTGEKGILLGQSHCAHCKKQLQALDLIPLISFLMLRGHCRYCHKKLSPHYFFLELITGMLFFLIAIKNPILINDVEPLSIDPQNALTLFFALLNSFWLIGIFFYDLQFLEIPDLFLFPFIGTAILGGLLTGTPDIVSMAIAIGISVIFFGGQILLSKGRWLGEGDLYVAIGMAAMLGWKYLLITIVMMYLIGSFLSLILLASQKAETKSKIAFAPFMVMGTLVTMFFGEPMLNWYLQLLNF